MKTIVILCAAVSAVAPLRAAATNDADQVNEAVNLTDGVTTDWR